jgi:membrane protein required for colicin V production
LSIHSIDWLNFNWIDYSIIAIILVSLLVGVIRGFVCEVISLITWIAALLLAFKFAAPLATHLTFIKSPMGAYIAAFAGIFLVILIIGITLNVLIRQLWRRTGVPVADRLLGLLLGIARGILIIALILLWVKGSPLKEEPVVKESQLIPPFKPVVDWLQNILPETIVHISGWTQEKTEKKE